MIENKTNDYKSHKHNFNVYVEINSKTKLGQDLLEQYHKQAKYQYSDIGRIGYHNEHGQYIIDRYTIAELISVPKLIIIVTEKAISKAGRDEYRLRTYMSKFGQLNFILLVDRSGAELILVENVFIENLNHKEDYETSIYKLRYSPREDVPLREIFYKFNIKANPDDYGKAWKSEQASINNVIVSTAKAAMTIKIANQVASGINQKALVTSLNYLNKENSYGKNVTKEYSKKVATTKEIKDLSTSPKLENTLNNVLVKTLEQQTTKTDVKDKTNFRIYKKVLDVELSTHSEVKKEVNKANTKQNLKEFMLGVYSKNSAPQEDEIAINEKKFKTFETIIEKQYSRTPNKEEAKPVEEDFKAKEIAQKMPENEKKQDFYDFNNKKLDIDFNLDRFKKPEDEAKKKEKKKQELILKKQEKKQIQIAKKQNKNIKILNAECNLDREFERSKQALGILPTDSKKKKKKALKVFFSEDTKKQKKEKNKLAKKALSQEESKDNILEKIEKQIRSQQLSGKNKEKPIKEKGLRARKKERRARKGLFASNLESFATENINEAPKKESKRKARKEKVKSNGLLSKRKQTNALSNEDLNFLKEYQLDETNNLSKHENSNNIQHKNINKNNVQNATSKNENTRIKPSQNKQTKNRLTLFKTKNQATAQKADDLNILNEYGLNDNTNIDNKNKSKNDRTKLNKTKQSEVKKQGKLRTALSARLKERDEKKKKKNARNLILDLEDKKIAQKQNLHNESLQKTTESSLNSAKIKETTHASNSANHADFKKPTGLETHREQHFEKPTVKAPPIEAHKETSVKPVVESENKKSGTLTKESQLQNFFNKKQTEQHSSPKQETPKHDDVSFYNPRHNLEPKPETKFEHTLGTGLSNAENKTNHNIEPTFYHSADARVFQGSEPKFDASHLQNQGHKKAKVKEDLGREM